MKSQNQLLLDVVNELQLMRVQIHAIEKRLDEAKLEVVLTVKGTARKRKRRRRVMPTELLVNQ